MFLNKVQMEKLNTKRLLAYKSKLMTYPESGCENPLCDCHCDDVDCYPDTMSKMRPEWKEAYKNIKEVLATREHVEKKK